jgi:DNA damage-binding protein 1
MVLSMVSANLRVFKPSLSANASGKKSSKNEMEDGDANAEYKSYLIIGTAYALHDEDEPTKGRIMVLSCNPDDVESGSAGSIQSITELHVRGGVYSMCQFYDGKLLVTVNSKTHICQLQNDGTGITKLALAGVGHHGHILSLFVSSRASKTLGPNVEATGDSGVASTATDMEESSKPKGKEEMLAVVGDLMRSISLVQYYPEHETLEEVARDFNTNWTTSVAMLSDDVYLGGENWNNLFVLRRNTKAQSEEIRCRLDTVGEFHLGEMCNKFMSGSLVMPTSLNTESSSSRGSSRRKSFLSTVKNGKFPASQGLASAAMRSKRPAVLVGSQTLFGTVDGTLGVILGLDGPTTAFFSCLERSMQRVITPVGNFSHHQFRAFNAEQRIHPSHGFVDGDLVESFLDLDKSTMQKVVEQMNRDGGWEVDDSTFVGGNDKNDSGMNGDNRPELSLEDALAVVEEMTMMH